MKNVMIALLVTIQIIAPVNHSAVGIEIQKEHVIILVDLSESALHVNSELFAKKAARFIGDSIDDMPLGSMVEIRTFGEYDRSKNVLSFKFMLSRKKGQRPVDVKRNIGLFVGNLPKLIDEGKLVLQDKTSIIGELKVLSEMIDSRYKTRIIILSDMLEYSAEANCYELIKSNNGVLPKTSGILNGVIIIALGAGYGCKNSKENDRLKVVWSEWFANAGVEEFKYLADF
jgi:hypothetical protein